jgi:hypothetical protein
MIIFTRDTYFTNIQPWIYNGKILTNPVRDSDIILGEIHQIILNYIFTFCLKHGLDCNSQLVHCFDSADVIDIGVHSVNADDSVALIFNLQITNIGILLYVDSYRTGVDIDYSPTFAELDFDMLTGHLESCLDDCDVGT